MIDIALKNGDIAKDSAGRRIALNDVDAKFQRVKICIAATLGGFIYDRTMGSQYRQDMSADAAELIINEALAKFENTYVKVLETGSTLKLAVIIDGERREQEVRFYGQL